MVVHEKALMREMKEAYKGAGYTVMVRPGDEWVISSRAWAVAIEGQGNVPNEVLSLIVLHMGFLPERETAYRVYKTDTGPAVQQETYGVTNETFETLQKQRLETDNAPVQIRRTKLQLGHYRVWQQTVDLRVLLIDPRYETVIDRKNNVRTVGDAIYAEGEISCAYVMRVQDAADKVQIEHLAQMQWVEK